MKNSKDASPVSDSSVPSMHPKLVAVLTKNMAANDAPSHPNLVPPQSLSSESQSAVFQANMMTEGSPDYYYDGLPQAGREETADSVMSVPHGTAAGVKHDAGKVRMDLVIGGFPRALLAVGDVATFGCKKYTENGWVTVPDGVKRYTGATVRHLLAEQTGELVDSDSGLLHAAHTAWGAMARLELLLREKANGKAT